MKKSNMMIIVAAATVLAACSDTIKLNNDLQQTAKTDKIGFAVYSEKATRADQTNSVNLYDFYKTFDVYAWKTTVDSVHTVFKHVPVEYFTKDTIGTYVYKTNPLRPSVEWGEYGADKTWTKGWFYENVRYWDKLASVYYFYAIAPYEVTPNPAIAVANGDANIKIGDATHTYNIFKTEKNLASPLTKDRMYYGFNKDYLLAERSETKFNQVSLSFHHILTKFNVMVTLQNTYNGTQPFTIKDLEIVGFENNGYFVYNNSITKNGWHTNADSTYNLVDSTDYILKNVPDSIADKTEYSGYYWFQTLVFPQTLTCDTVGSLTTAPASKYLYVEYTIGKEPFKAYYDLAYVFGCTQDANNNTYDLEQGSEYTINIKVGPEPIVFEAKASTWADDLEINHSAN